MVNRTENQSTFSIDDQNRLPQLDGLRGVFVALVVVFHAGISWAGGFYSAVDGFFRVIWILNYVFACQRYFTIR